jgi:hypothetical protein
MLKTNYQPIAISKLNGYCKIKRWPKAEKVIMRTERSRKKVSSRNNLRHSLQKDSLMTGWAGPGYVLEGKG